MMEGTGRVFGIGLSRTATTSLTEALELLGIASLHMPPFTYAGGAVRIDPEALRRFRGLTDTPVAAGFRDLDRAFPGSKFILTTRDIDAWSDSCQRYFGDHPWDREPWQQLHIDLYGTNRFERERWAESYQRHNREVVEYFADRPDDLLVIDLCDSPGWTELCEFLDLPVPAADFPHTNRSSSRSYHERTQDHSLRARMRHRAWQAKKRAFVVARTAGFVLASGVGRVTERRRPTTPRPLAIAIHTWDGYRRFWKPARHYAAAHLSDELPRFFVSERSPVDDDRFEPLLTGEGSFVKRLLIAATELEKRGFRYVLYLQEDQWVTEPVGLDDLEEFVDLMEAERLDVLKLGEESFWTAELDRVQATGERLGSDGVAARFRWFGDNQFGMSHHMSIFRLRFLIESLQVCLRLGRVRPLQHETFTSEHLQQHIVARHDDGKKYRIAVWADEPAIDYVHASAVGQLTEDAERLLRRDGLTDLYEPDLRGEVFPTHR